MCCPTDPQSILECADPYLGHRPIAQAFTKYITTTPTLRPHSSATAPTSPHLREALDLYVARVVHTSQVPCIVPYTALYLLAAISQCCSCSRRLSQASSSDDDVFGEDAPATASPFSHAFSRATTRTPFSRVRKSHWVGHHMFMGAFLVTLRAYRATPAGEGTLGMDVLSEISGFSEDELEELDRAVLRCMGRDLRVVVDSMVWERDFRRINEVECPRSVERRRRLSQMEKGNHERPHLRRSLSSLWRLRGKTVSGIETESSSIYSSSL